MTHSLTIDGRQFASGRAVHEMMKTLLHFPAHYGCNADALWDVLQENEDTIHLRILSWGAPDTARALRCIARVLEDTGASVERCGE